MRVIENPLEIRHNQCSGKLMKNRECDDKCITITVIFSFAYCRDHFLCQGSLFKNIHYLGLPCMNLFYFVLRVSSGPEQTEWRTLFRNLVQGLPHWKILWQGKTM